MSRLAVTGASSLGCAVALVCAVGPAGLGAAPRAAVAEAAMQRDREAVRTLLTQGGDVNAAQGDGMTALHWAASHNDVELARMLIYAGANLRAATRINGYTPLLMAAKGGHARIVKTLLESGADARAASVTGTSPLMLAAAAGSLESVSLLLDAGADPNATESTRGQTAIMFAAAYNRVSVISTLARREADVAASSKVVDLHAFTEEDAERRPVQGSAQRRPQVAGADRNFVYTELIGHMGGFTPLLLAARDGHVEAATALLDAGAGVNQVSAGDRTSPLLVATINGHFDLARLLLDKGADPGLAAENGVTPLYAALNCQWAPKANYPQPRAHLQQKRTYLDLMRALLEKGADPNVRVNRKVWYSGYNSDLSGIDEIGATPFWRAAYASDVDGMRLLVAHGADPSIPTMKPAGRRFFTDGAREQPKDVSGLPPVPVGGPSMTALHAATGVGYAEGFAANSHRIHPAGWMPAVKYLVEELGLDVNARDHDGNTALHHAASRGDNAMIRYLVSKGADVTAVTREGQTTADMANGPVQRTQPYPETLALLMKLGAKNNNRCVSC
ncbi:MAG: ankyrin repeat domain-containing protein [Vicinamibacterales bacterium]